MHQGQKWKTKFRVFLQLWCWFNICGYYGTQIYFFSLRYWFLCMMSLAVTSSMLKFSVKFWGTSFKFWLRPCTTSVIAAVKTICRGMVGKKWRTIRSEKFNLKKKHLKDLIQENIAEIVFVKCLQRNKSEQIMSSSTQTAALNMYSEVAADENDMMSLWKLAKN